MQVCLLEQTNPGWVEQPYREIYLTLICILTVMFFFFFLPKLLFEGIALALSLFPTCGICFPQWFEENLLTSVWTH